MRRPLLSTARFAAGVALVLMAIPAAADPIIRYNWDRSEPFVRNRDYEGPGLYTQTLSITGLPAGIKSLVVSIEVNVGWQTAWDFLPRRCAGPERLGARPFVAECDTIPGIGVLAQWQRPYDAPMDDLYLLFQFDAAFVPDPDARYGLATITFDHELAETDCYGAAVPLCFLLGAGFYKTGDAWGFAYPEHDRLTWNDSSAVPDCAPRRQGLPARPSSWGSVKSLYR